MVNVIKVGVALIVFRACERGTEVLLGLRQGSHAAGEWACPGGHLEWGERSDECCRRELMEECGLEPTSDIKQVGWEEVTYGHEQHTALYFWCEGAKGEPQLMEPAKCAGWQWFPTDALPDSLMANTSDFIKRAEPQYLDRRTDS